MSSARAAKIDLKLIKRFLTPHFRFWGSLAPLFVLCEPWGLGVWAFNCKEITTVSPDHSGHDPAAVYGENKLSAEESPRKLQSLNEQDRNNLIS